MPVRVIITINDIHFAYVLLLVADLSVMLALMAGRNVGSTLSLVKNGQVSILELHLHPTSFAAYQHKFSSDFLLTRLLFLV